MKVLMFFFFLFLFIYTPVIAVLITSVCDCRFPSLPWPGNSMKWYVGFWQEDKLQASILAGIGVSFAVSTACTLIGLFVGVRLAKLPKIKAELFLLVFTLPVFLPAYLYGLGALATIQVMGLNRSLFIVTLLHIVLFTPIVIAGVYHRFQQLDKAIEEAAIEFGAGSIRILLQIIAPQMWAILAGLFLFVFVLSFDEYTLSWFVSGFQKTYSVIVREMFESTISPLISAVSIYIVIFFGAAISVLAILIWIFKQTVINEKYN